MKPIKTLGLTVLAALMALAFAAAPSAMAESTALCETDPGTGSTAVCAVNNLISHVHEATLSGAKAVLLASPTIECDVLFLGDVTTANKLGNPLAISGNFTYTNCGPNCGAVTETSANATQSVLKLGHELGDVTYTYVVSFNCVGINCEYNGLGVLGHALGPLLSNETNGGVRVEEQTLNKLPGGFLCPKTAKLDYLPTPLIKTFIAN